MKKYISLLFFIVTCSWSIISAQDPRERTYQYEILEPRHESKPIVQGFAKERITENLNRGFTAVISQDKKSVYLTWRLLNNDPSQTSFNVYRTVNGKWRKLNAKPIFLTTDYTDIQPINGLAQYKLVPLVDKKETGKSETLEVDFTKLRNYSSIKINAAERVGKMAVADLNGDGSYDFIVRTPDSNVDPGMPADTTGITYKISAYLSDGTYLWTYDLGLGIEPGVWYSPFMAYDFNGDGKAEVVLKAAGNDYKRNEKWRIFAGSEYLLVLDGMTGKEIARAPWTERNFRYGDVNRQNRNQIGMAYLDGKTPCILAARGTYKLMVVDAWQLKGNKLEKLWRWDGDEENPVVRSQGAHNMVCGDVDGDGRDEVLLGACMLDDNGTLLWSAGLGHPDKTYLTQIDPSLEGMQVFMVSEPWQNDGRGVMMVDAKTGKQIWKIGISTYHVGDGMVADFDPTQPGLECFASEDQKGGSSAKYLLNAKGLKLNSTNDEVPDCRNWAWWDADLLRETLSMDFGQRNTTSSEEDEETPEARRERFRRRFDAGMKVSKFKGNSLTDSIKGSIMMIADIAGDWREEIITVLPGEIRIYQTNIPASDRRVTLMQDPIYRSYVLQRSQGYPQSPVTGYYLGVK